MAMYSSSSDKGGHVVMTALSFILLGVVGQALAQDLDINDWTVQADSGDRRDVEGDANMDLKFDLEMTSMEKRPAENKKFPIVDRVNRLYEAEKDRLMAEAKAQGDDLFENSTVSISWAFQYYEMFDWAKNVLKCCPLKWKYQCRSSKVRMPCFYSYNRVTGKYEWCCPYWPKVLIAQCDCCQCAVLTSACAHQGQCRRRYTRTSFVAVCYRNKRWAYLRYIVKPLPTSCYCRIK